jgi:RNA polymerase sigma factor (sigma-70 family)
MRGRLSTPTLEPDVTTTLQRIEGPGDGELIAAVRGGDGDAYGLLFERHVDAARRLARQLVAGPDADDLVSEAFAKVLVVLKRGGGPDLAFRAYLLTAVRRLHVDKVRAGSRLHTTDDLAPFDPGVPFRDTAVEGFESAAAARAFASLPERWQLVLWHTEVEGQKPAEVAPLLGMSPNSVSALAYRAREGLRQAFLTMHAQEAESDACEWTHQNLGGYLRNGLSRRDTARVEQHLEGCRPCAGIYLELTEVNSDIAALLAPALLGGAAAAYLGSGTGGGAAVGSLLVALDRAKDVVIGHAAVSATAGAAASAVAVGAVVVTLQTGGEPVLAAPPLAPPASTATGDAGSAAAGAAAGEPGAEARALRDLARGHGRSAVPPGVMAEVGLGSTGATPVPSESPLLDPDSTTPTEAAGPEAEQPTPMQQPDPAETEAPAPETDPPAPDPEPPAEEEPPAPLPHDLAVSAVTDQHGKGATDVWVTVTGLPDGHSATLTAQGIDVATLSSHDDRCGSAGDKQLACTIGNTPTTVGFRANAKGGAVVFTVALDGEGTDTDPGNNSTTVSID